MADYVGQQWGNYRLIELIDNGGFTDVYLGQHVRLPSQQAAVKILATRLNPQDVEAFEHETNLIAGLTHPHIVRLLDYDVANGVPFLVMEYAPKGSLRRLHRSGEIVPLFTVVSYVKQLASALQYVHDKGLLHRDVKPDNMLLDERGQVLLSDFGIATIARSATEESNEEAFIGTMPYAAPELLQHQPQPASDQYALGITVYEWLAGQRPFLGSFTEIAIKHATYPPPSLLAKNPLLSPMVEQVVFTALAKDPAARFRDVLTFADDLESAILDTAHEVTAVTLPRALWPVTQPDSAGLLVAAAQNGTSAQPILQAEHGVALLEVEQKGADQRAEPQNDAPAQPIPSEVKLSLPITPIPEILSMPSTAPASDAEEMKHDAPVIPASEEVEYELPPALAATKEKPEQRWKRFSRRSMLAGLVGAGVVVVGEASVLAFLRRAPAAPSRQPQQPPRLRYVYRGHTAPVTGIDWSPDGKYLASASYDRTVQVWQASNGSALFSYRGHTSGVNAAAWSADGKFVASASYDESVQIWRGDNGLSVMTYAKHKGIVNDVTWSPGGQRLASANDDKTVRVWDEATGTTAFVYHTHTGIVNTVAWSPNGQRVASAGADNVVRVWNAVTGISILAYAGHSAAVNAVAWSPDGSLLASASDDRTVQVWQASTGKNIFTYRGHHAQVKALAWSPDGQRIASAGYDHTVQVWQARDGSHALIYHGHKDNVNGVAWSPDGASIASSSNDSTVQVWRAN